MANHPAPSLTRRHFLHTASSFSAAAITGVAGASPAASGAEILDTRMISLDSHHYHGWPTLMRRRNGQLMLAYSGGREEHICPFGRVELMVSNDDGHTWGWPRVVFDSDIDDRDAGIFETRAGTLLINTASTLSYDTLYLQAALRKKPGEKGRWAEAKLKAWQAAHNRLPTDAQRQAQQGAWMLRSTDGGVTWSPRYPTPVFAPHGPIQLADGRLLYAGKELFQKTSRIGIAESTDDGLTWQWLAAFPTRPGDKEGYYAEPHLTQAADGRIIVHLRNENTANFRETLQCESRDGGQTWSDLRPIAWGMPAHLLKLRSGALVTSYGHRREPFGVQARLSRDHGETWSEAMTVCADAANTDHGYPSTVELEDGTLLTVWYEVPKDRSPAVLRQARWKIV